MESVSCKLCGSQSAIRYGRTSVGRPRLLCKACGRTFLPTGAPVGMRYSAPVIASALDHFYQGWPLRSIERHLQMVFGARPSHSRIFGWAVKYAAKADRAMRAPAAWGPVWLLLRTLIRTPRNRASARSPRILWVWEAIDAKSLYLIATNVSRSGTQGDAETFLRKAAPLALEQPLTLVSDASRSLLEAVDKVYGADLRHIRSAQLLSASGSIEGIEVKNVQGMLRERRRILGTVRSEAAIDQVAFCWRVHYNLVRPHPALMGSTPREAAGLPYEARGWLDVVTLPVPPT